MSGFQTQVEHDSKPDTVVVYKFEVYDIHSDQFIVSRRYATPSGAKRLHGRLLVKTEIRIPWQDLEQGEEWTAIGYEP